MANLLARLLPRERSFFTMFTELTGNIEKGALALAELFRDYREVDTRVQQIKEIEHRGDALTHDIMTKLNQTFITPLDHEDIHELANKLDDILDLINSVATRLLLYRIAKPRPGALELAEILVRATTTLHTAISHLESGDRILDHCHAIDQMEKESDATVRAAIARLFEEEKDPVELIKWKEILEVLETASDKCDDVANILEAVVLKSA